MGPVGVGPLEALLGVDIFSEMRAGGRVFSVQKKAIAAQHIHRVKVRWSWVNRMKEDEGLGELEFPVEGHGQ